MKYAVLICLIFLISFSLVPANYRQGTVDYTTHLHLARGDIMNDLPTDYPPLFHWLAKPFAVRAELFWIFDLFIFTTMIPLALYYITKKEITVLFYFCFSSFWLEFSANFLPLGLALFFCLVIIAIKNNYLRFFLVMLATITHSSGFYFSAFIFALCIIKELDFKIPSFLMCLPGWGGVNPKIVSESIAFSEGKPIFNQTKINHFISLFVKKTPLFILILSLWQYLKQKDFHYIIIIISLFIGGTIVNPRIFSAIFLFALPGFVWWYSEQNIKTRKYVVVIAIFYLVFQLFQYFANSLNWFC